MKKVLVVIPAFSYGGTIKSLENYMSFLSMDNSISIDILAMTYNGTLKSKFEKFNLLSENKQLAAFYYPKEVLKRCTAKQKAAVMFFTLKKKFGGKKYEESLLEIIAKQYYGYNTVIAFQEGRATKFASFIECENKIAWVRCDYGNYLGITDVREDEIYKKYNKVVCVSQYTANIFRKIYPEFADKIRAIHNIINSEYIIEQSKEDFEDSSFQTDCFTIISVGRNDKVKQFEKIPEILSRIKQSDICVKWYLISNNGNMTDKTKENIEKYKVNNDFILLGAKENPYPYIAHSDLLCCTSLSEACPNVINEAKILHVPVVTTNFGSAEEFIGDGDYGKRVPIENMPSEIISLMQDKQKYDKIKNNCNNFFYDNSDIYKEIIELIKD